MGLALVELIESSDAARLTGTMAVTAPGHSEFAYVRSHTDSAARKPQYRHTDGATAREPRAR
jgi:hypothetical protein